MQVLRLPSGFKQRSGASSSTIASSLGWLATGDCAAAATSVCSLVSVVALSASAAGAAAASGDSRWSRLSMPPFTIVTIVSTLSPPVASAGAAGAAGSRGRLSAGGNGGVRTDTQMVQDYGLTKSDCAKSCRDPRPVRMTAIPPTHKLKYYQSNRRMEMDHCFTVISHGNAKAT